MQLLSSTGSRLRHAVARGWRALADVHRNQVRVRERYYRYYRPQREWAVARSRDSGMPGAAGTKGGASGPDRSLRGCGREPSAVKGQVAPVTQDGHRDAAIKYQALVTVSPSEDGGLDAEPPRLVRRLAVRACHRETHRSELFSALVTAADGSPLKPGVAGGS